MVEQLVGLIGASDGASKPFEDWRMAAIQAGLNPGSIQNMKRRGLLHTRISPEGVHEIVRGPSPAKTTV